MEVVKGDLGVKTIPVKIITGAPGGRGAAGTGGGGVGVVAGREAGARGVAAGSGVAAGVGGGVAAPRREAGAHGRK